MYKEIRQNKQRTALIIFLFILLISIFGYFIGLYITNGDYNSSFYIMAVFTVFSIFYSIFSYYASSKIALKMSHANEINKKTYPKLYNIVDNLSITAGLPTPKIYIINDTALNAFATGRDPKHASVTITSGLLDQLDKVELEGVIAHELSHIKNYDIRLQTIIIVLIGFIILISDLFLRNLIYRGGMRSTNRSSNKGGNMVFLLIAIVFAILTPVIAKIMQLALSRQREYLADANAIMLTRYPKGLIRALRKISLDTEALEVANKATAHLYIENPLRNEKRKSYLDKMFSTHPAIEDRINRLKTIM